MHGGWDIDVDLDASGAEPLGERDPHRIGPFPLIGVLGSGGMGRVYLGVAAPGRYAAVKQVLPEFAEDETFLRHFGRELDNLGRLPAGVSAGLLDSDRDCRPPWFAGEYIPGLTLADALGVHGGPLPVEALWPLLRDAASGLVEVHSLDMVHRDLKPSNVMLTLDGVTLIDFGVARAADQSRLTKTGAVTGTPAYMAPEQTSAQGQLTGAADVFALASVLSYAAIGAPPFGEGAGPDVLYRIVHDEPELGPVRAVDARLADILRSCLDKDPAARPAAAELRALARAHTEDAAQPPWPAAVRDRIAARAAFAVTAPDPAGFPAPSRTRQEPPPAGAPGATPDAGAEAGRRRKRRRLALLLVVPLVVGAAATLPILLAPGNGEAEGAAPPGSSVSSPSATGGARPSASAARTSAGTPSRAPSSPAAGQDPAQQPAAGGTGGAGGTGTTAGNGTDGGTSAGANTGGSASGGSASGGSASGGSGASPTGPATPAPPSGQGQVTSYSNAQCLGDMSFLAGHTPELAACGSQGRLAGPVTYTWTYSAASGGTFRLVSEAAGSCLTGGSLGNLAGLSTCNSSSSQQWQIGTATAHGSTYRNVASGQCLVVASGRSIGTTACDSAQAKQIWYKS